MTQFALRMRGSIVVVRQVRLSGDFAAWIVDQDWCVWLPRAESACTPRASLNALPAVSWDHMSAVTPPRPPPGGNRPQGGGNKKGRTRRFTTQERRDAYGTTAKRMGAPTLLTQDVHDKIVSLIRAGNYFETACRVADMEPRTVYNWLAVAESETSAPEYRNFLHAVRRAQAEAEALLVNDVRLAGSVDAKGQPKGSKHWAASLALLERKFPSRWSKQDTTVIRHEHDALPTVTATVETSTPEAALDVLERATAVLAYAERRAQKRLGAKK